MFHLFHKYGKLAQISIKQAYGFIQFLEAEACHAALQVEQGAMVRGRKIRELIPNGTKNGQSTDLSRPGNFQAAKVHQTWSDGGAPGPSAPKIEVARIQPYRSCPGYCTASG
jgi:hypothetical protein